MSAPFHNLDALCARHGWEMAGTAKNSFGADKKAAEKAENLITQALAVLQEQGVYAFFLFLRSRPSKQQDAADKISLQAQEALRELHIKPFDAVKHPDVLSAVRDMSNDLDDLLLAKRVLEQSLIYARYHAKALGVQNT